MYFSLYIFCIIISSPGLFTPLMYFRIYNSREFENFCENLKIQCQMRILSLCDKKYITSSQRTIFAYHRCSCIKKAVELSELFRLIQQLCNPVYISVNMDMRSYSSCRIRARLYSFAKDRGEIPYFRQRR